MADSDLRPIQVFLDTKRFIDTPEPQPFVPGTKDFFQGNNRGFVEHKTKLKASRIRCGGASRLVDSSRSASVKRH
jgi:hypothetical protein